MTKMYRFINVNKSGDNSERVEILYGKSNPKEIIKELSQNYFGEIKNNKEDKIITAKYIGMNTVLKHHSSISCLSDLLAMKKMALQHCRSRQ